MTRVVATRGARALLLACVFAAAACERKPAPPPPPAAGIPQAAVFYLAAPTLTELAALTAPLHTLPTDLAADAPAWFACTVEICALRRAAPTAEDTGGGDAPWIVSDRDGALVVWGATDRDALQPVLDAFRAGKPPATDRAHGAVQLQTALQLWRPQQAQAQALVSEASEQLGWLNFDVVQHERSVDLRFKQRPTASLGAPLAELPNITGLPTAQLLGALRLSAAPGMIWSLFQHTSTPERRAEIDTLLTQFSELGLDLERDLIATLTGEIAIFYFDFVDEASEVTVTDIARLAATEEALILGVEDAVKLRHTIDALGQISQSDAIDGSLVALNIRGDSDTHRWAWMVDEQLRASITLTPTMLAIVDSVVAQEQFEQRDQPLDPALADSVGLLLQAERHSGVYVNVDRIRHLMPYLPKELTAVTAVVEVDESGGERTLIRLAF